MVEYRFDYVTAKAVEALAKRQTVRKHRPERHRHAMPGERLQLFSSPTKESPRRRLVRPDPLCTKVNQIRMEISDRKIDPAAPAAWIEKIEVAGQLLDEEAREDFAIAEGFGMEWQQRPALSWHSYVTPLLIMSMYFHSMGGARVFEGVVVHWDPTR